MIRHQMIITVRLGLWLGYHLKVPMSDSPSFEEFANIVHALPVNETAGDQIFNKMIIKAYRIAENVLIIICDK